MTAHSGERARLALTTPLMTLLLWVVVLFCSCFQTCGVEQTGSIMAEKQSTEEKWHSTKSEAQKCPEDQETQKEEAKEETGASNQSNQDTQTKEETEDQKCLSKPEDQDTQKEENKEEAAGESDQDTQTKEEVGTSDQKFLSEPVDQKEEAREEAEKLTVPATVVDSSIKPEEENDSTKKEDEETVSPKESDASSTDAPAKPEAKPISTRIKHPMTKLPKTLHEFGYTFKDGKLQNISSGEGFVFEVIRGDKTYNQQHYEALGEVITEHVYTLLESETNLQRIPVPIPNPKQQGAASSFFFASKDYLTNPKMMVLIHGSGVVRAGQWARRLIINDCLDSGTQLPFIKRADAEGYSVVVLNTNLNYQHIAGKKKSVKGNSTPEEHAKYVWKNFITKSSASKIYIVAHSYGGIVTTELANECFKEFRHLVQKIAFTDSVHSVQRLKRAVKSWIKENARNWVSSNDPLDHPQQTLRSDVPRVSAGTNKHEETSWFSFASIFGYFKEELEKATEDDAHVPDVSAGTMQDNAQTQDDAQLCTTEPTS